MQWSTQAHMAYLSDSTHARNGANVVGDGDQCGFSQVLLGGLLPPLLAHHVAKAVNTTHPAHLKTWVYQVGNYI